MSRGRSPDDLFDWAAIGGVLVLIGHSIRRHRAVFALTWLAVVGLALGLMVGMPRTYEVEASLQFQRNQVLSTLGATTPSKEADAPTKAAAQMVLKHENLVALVNQTDMVHAWFKHRALLLQLKDAIDAKIRPPPDEEELVEDFVGMLENRLWVNTSADGVVSIGIQLPNPQLAFLVVDGALENFLEARHAAEVSAIGEEIGILQARADEAQESVVKAVDDLQSLRMQLAAKLGKRPQRMEPLVPLTPDERTSQLQGEAESKRRAIADLEEFRRRRITQLETTLQEQRALYSENHPAVQDILQALEAVRHESPQILALRRDLATLEAELKRRGLLVDAPTRARRARDAALQSAAMESENTLEMEDPDIEYAKASLRYRIKQYNGLLERVQAARLEEDTARAAFKYRYSIVRPPQRPSGPVAPRPGLVIVSSVLAGLLLAVLATAFLDFSSKKFLEPWQVEHALGVPLLGVIRLS